MYRVKGQEITELGALMDAMVIDWNSIKTYVEVRLTSQDMCEVREHFDDGKGHSGAFTCNTTEVDPLIFLEAQSRGYITGKLMPGFVSKREFVLTENKNSIAEIWKIVEMWRNKALANCPVDNDRQVEDKTA